MGATLVLFIMAAAVSYSQLTVMELLLAAMPKGFIRGANVLVVGIDDTRGTRRSDTIMVVHVNPDGQRLGILSIPRDCKVSIPGVGITKINHAYAYGGVNLVRETVSQFLKTPIHYYVLLHLRGVQQLVDSVGGVVVDVKHNMRYVDQAGGLYIDLNKGRQRLNGLQSLSYVRFRNDAHGDLGRIERQQEFLHRLAERLKSVGLLTKLPLLVEHFGQHVETDLLPQEMLSLGLQMSKAYHQGLIQSATLPGAVTLEDGVSYWRIDPQGSQRIMDRVLFGFEDKDPAPSKGWIQEAAPSLRVAGALTQPADAMPGDQPPVDLTLYMGELTDLAADHIFPEKAVVAMTVLNGNGQRGVAGRTAEWLQKFDVRITRVADADRLYHHSLIYCSNERESIQAALYLAKFLGLDPLAQVQVVSAGPLTLVLGTDWNEPSASEASQLLVQSGL